jgi:hypothetical protein
MKPWCTPGGVSDSTDNESGEHGVVLSERITMKPMNDLGISGRDDCTINENNKKNEGSSVAAWLSETVLRGRGPGASGFESHRRGRIFSKEGTSAGPWMCVYV